ncbi:TPA: hypothetical protein ACH3X1_003556 [Trebouxia sp. C0004]
MDIATSALREIAQAGLARVQTMCTSGWIHHELHVPSDASEADVPGLNDDPEVMNLPDGSITLDMEQADACFEDAAGISFAHGVIERIMIIDLYDQPAEGSVRTTLDHSSDAVTQHKAYRAYRATALAFVRMVISNPLEGYVKAVLAADKRQILNADKQKAAQACFTHLQPLCCQIFRSQSFYRSVAKCVVNELVHCLSTFSAGQFVCIRQLVRQMHRFFKHTPLLKYHAAASVAVQVLLSCSKDAAVNGTQNWFEIRAGHQMHACLIFESNTRVDA